MIGIGRHPIDASATREARPTRIAEATVASRRLAAVAAMASGAPVLPIPEDREIAAMRDAMIHIGRPSAASAPRMLVQEGGARQLPLAPIESPAPGHQLPP